MRATGAGPAWIFCTESRAGAAIPPPAVAVDCAPRQCIALEEIGARDRAGEFCEDMRGGPLECPGGNAPSVPGGSPHPARACTQ